MQHLINLSRRVFKSNIARIYLKEPLVLFFQLRSVYAGVALHHFAKQNFRCFSNSRLFLTNKQPCNSELPGEISKLFSPNESSIKAVEVSPSKNKTKPEKEKKPKPVAQKVEFSETDIKEKFIKGSGNGGQAINKTNSRVELTHIPTGIVVQCQKTRSQAQNRKIARKLLLEKLDNHINGKLSKSSLKAAKVLKQKKKKRKKALDKIHGKKILDSSDVKTDTLDTDIEFLDDKAGSLDTEAEFLDDEAESFEADDEFHDDKAFDDEAEYFDDEAVPPIVQRRKK